MRRWVMVLCVVLLLIGCSATELVVSTSSSQVASHSISIPAWMEEDYKTTGKYDFHVPSGVLVEYILAVPDFLDPSQQYLYVEAMNAYRAFSVEPGFRPDESEVYVTDLPYDTYVRETAFEDSADLADYLRSLFDFELFQKLFRAYVPVESSSIPIDDGPALAGQSLYAEFDGRLYVLRVAQTSDAEYPFPSEFRLLSNTDTKIVFETCYDDGMSCTLEMVNTDAGWLFSEFSTPYDGKIRFS